MDMGELIARLEAASEGSDELNRAIFHDGLGNPPQPTHCDACKQTRWVFAPAYTQSLDAALTLVPEGWTAWELRSFARKTRFGCDLSRLTECDAGEDWAHGNGPTPALALCIAALRALASAPGAAGEERG